MTKEKWLEIIKLIASFAVGVSFYELERFVELADEPAVVDVDVFPPGAEPEAGEAVGSEFGGVLVRVLPVVFLLAVVLRHEQLVAVKVKEHEVRSGGVLVFAPFVDGDGLLGVGVDDE